MILPILQEFLFYRGWSRDSGNGISIFVYGDYMASRNHYALVVGAVGGFPHFKTIK